MPNKNEKLTRFCLIFCAVLTLALCWRWQRIFYLMCADYIMSDVPAHIRLALGRNDYSLASWIVRTLWELFGEARGQTALSFVLTANQLLSILTVWLLLRRMFPAPEDAPRAYPAALLAHVCGTWIFPGQTEMYLGAYNGNVLHNMTMLFSRTPIPLVLLFFFRLWEKRGERLPLRDWLGLSLSLLLSTFFKPSFLGAFAPVVLAMLIWDFIRTRCRGVKNEFLIGLAVVPSLLVLLWASSVLYAEDFAGTSSGMALRVISLPLLAALLVKYLRGLLLPLWSAALPEARGECLRGRLRILWGVLGVSIAQALLLTETGYRANDGNFEWGSLSLYVTVFAVSIALLLRALRKTDWKRRPERIKALVGIVLLLGHLVIGAYCLYRPGHAGYEWMWF